MRRTGRHTTAGPGREELRELRVLRGSAPQVLAGARGEDLLAVALPDALALRRAGQWSQVAWQDIQHGSWDGERNRLQWVLVDGTEDGVVLTEAGQLPGVFVERVQASILVQEQVGAPGGGTVLLSGRRNPAGHGPVIWTAEPSARVAMDDPAVRKFIVGESERLADEYGL